MRPVRTAKAPDPQRTLTAAEIENLPVDWRAVITGVMEIDIGATHSRLLVELRPSLKQMTGSELMTALDRVTDNIRLAHSLKNKARAEYELYKEAHAEWLEPKRSSALIALEKDKKEQELKKQITEAMIDARVVATWPEEYRPRIQKLKSLQAAVHELEDLHETWKSRGNRLSDLKDLFKSLVR